MPRPKLKSDDEVLEAATVVLKRCTTISNSSRHMRKRRCAESLRQATNTTVVD